MSVFIKGGGIKFSLKIHLVTISVSCVMTSLDSDLIKLLPGYIIYKQTIDLKSEPGHFDSPQKCCVPIQIFPSPLIKIKL